MVGKAAKYKNIKKKLNINKKLNTLLKGIRSLVLPNVLCYTTELDYIFFKQFLPFFLNKYLKQIN